MTGTWNVFIKDHSTFVIDFTQNGQQLTGAMQGPFAPTFTGTITGNDFSVEAFAAPLAYGQLQGTVGADGNGFSGVFNECTLECSAPHPQFCHCPSISTYPMRACRVGAPGDCCGDGVVGASEQCDPGPTDACCDASCQITAPGTACAGDGNVCNVNTCDASGSCVMQGPAPSGTSCPSDVYQCTDAAVCDGAGTCTQPPSPSGTPCSPDFDVCTPDVCDGAGSCSHLPGTDGDADGICDAIDPCTNGVPLVRPRLVVSGKPSLSTWNEMVIRGRAQFPPSMVIDPPSSGMHVIVGNVDPAVWYGVHLTLPAGPPVLNGEGWRVGRNGHFRYRSADTPPGWDAKVTVSSRTPGLVKFDVKGTGFIAQGPSTGTSVYVRLALGMTEVVTERCTDVTFTGPQRPVCTISPTKLSCR